MFFQRIAIRSRYNSIWFFLVTFVPIAHDFFLFNFFL